MCLYLTSGGALARDPRPGEPRGLQDARGEPPRYLTSLKLGINVSTRPYFISSMDDTYQPYQGKSLTASVAVGSPAYNPKTPRYPLLPPESVLTEKERVTRVSSAGIHKES